MIADQNERSGLRNIVSTIDFNASEFESQDYLIDDPQEERAEPVFPIYQLLQFAKFSHAKTEAK